MINNYNVQNLNKISFNNFNNNQNNLLNNNVYQPSINQPSNTSANSYFTALYYYRKGEEITNYYWNAINGYIKLIDLSKYKNACYYFGLGFFILDLLGLPKNYNVYLSTKKNDNFNSFNIFNKDPFKNFKYGYNYPSDTLIFSIYEPNDNILHEILHRCYFLKPYLITNIIIPFSNYYLKEKKDIFNNFKKNFKTYYPKIQGLKKEKHYSNLCLINDFLGGKFYREIGFGHDKNYLEKKGMPIIFKDIKQVLSVENIPHIYEEIVVTATQLILSRNLLPESKEVLINIAPSSYNFLVNKIKEVFRDKNGDLKEVYNKMKYLYYKSLTNNQQKNP